MLRKKTLLGVGTTLIVLILLLYIVTRQIVLREFVGVEQQLVTRNLSRINSIFEDDQRSLAASIVDWSEWDATYDYIKDRNPEYISNNISDELFKMYRLNVILYVSMDGAVVFSDHYDATEHSGEDLTEALAARLEQDVAFRDRVIPPPDLPVNAPGVSGVLRTAHGPMLVAIGPILNSFGEGEPHGALIWARYLGAQEAERFSTLNSLPITFVALDDRGAALDPTQANVTLTSAQPTLVLPASEATTHGYSLITDLTGQPGFVFDVAVTRDVYQRGQATLGYLLASLLAVGLGIGGVALVLIERLMLARLAQLNRAVLRIGEQNDFSLRVPDGGQDELSNLGRTINATLDALSRSQGELKALNADLESRVAARTAELRARQNYLQAVLDTIKEGVFFGNPRAIYAINDFLAAMCGFSADELLGQAPTRLLDDTLAEFVGQADGLTPASSRSEGKLRCKDGSTLDVAVTISPYVELDDQGGHIYVVRDISEERALQVRKDRFLADASHELRNPITSLMTRLYLLRKNPERLEAHLDILDTVVAHMRALVEDLLDATRFNQGLVPIRREITHLQPLIDAVVEHQRPEAEIKNLTLTCVCAAEPIYASVDAKRMAQVITNLVSNAVHYTHPGGSVTVELETRQTASSLRIVMMVRDTGIGISEEHLPQLFLPFFRVNPDTPGTGLGLPIVKEIVGRHNGEISVESTLGVGSVFTVTLTAAEAHPTATQKDAALV